MDNFLVSTFYATDGTSFEQDEIAMDAVGRDTDESGWGGGERDLGWLCETESEANEIKAALENIGMTADIAKL